MLVEKIFHKHEYYTKLCVQALSYLKKGKFFLLLSEIFQCLQDTVGEERRKFMNFKEYFETNSLISKSQKPEKSFRAIDYYYCFNFFFLFLFHAFLLL